MTVILCVQLWARAGREAELIAYEDRVLALLERHGGRLLQRVRAADPGAGAGADSGADPYEVQLIRFAGEAGFDAYLADPDRTAYSAERDVAVERTLLSRVELVTDDPSGVS